LGFHDYSGIEVRIAACFTEDPALIAYIHDPTTDMHRDQAKEVFLLNHEQVTYDIRFYTKNCLVFPEFYGSWYKACATNLAENCFDLPTGDGIPMVDHLYDQGIRRYEDFEDHVKTVEKRFWEKFHVYKSWKDQAIQDYIGKGYVDMFFGHRRSGHLSNNMILNTPIQGTAFHCLLWSYIELDKMFAKFKTSLIGQIHDEILEDIDPSEEKDVVELTRYIMCDKIREEHDWIIVPLHIESEYTDIDGNWYDKK
jgi:DNA polymerase-1